MMEQICDTSLGCDNTISLLDSHETYVYMYACMHVCIYTYA